MPNKLNLNENFKINLTHRNEEIINRLNNVIKIVIPLMQFVSLLSY